MKKILLLLPVLIFALFITPTVTNAAMGCEVPNLYNTFTGQKCTRGAVLGVANEAVVSRYLAPDMKGEEVIKLQTFLNKHGYLKVTPDGTYGPKTTAAVQNFQLAYKLTPTGTIDASTSSVMGALENTDENGLEIIGRAADEPWALVFILGEFCYVAQTDGGANGHYTYKARHLSQPNLCNVLTALGVGRASIQALDKDISDNETLINQVGTSCVYYTPTKDGWTKGKTVVLPKDQKRCSAPDGTITIPSVTDSIINGFIENSGTLTNREAWPPNIVYTVGNFCVIGKNFDGIGYTSVTITPFNGHTLCEALSGLTITRSAVQAIDSEISPVTPIISQSGSSCTYYNPTSDGWTKGKITTLSAGQKMCPSKPVGEETVTVGVDTFLENLPETIELYQKIVKDPETFKSEVIEGAGKLSSRAAHGGVMMCIYNGNFGGWVMYVLNYGIGWHYMGTYSSEASCEVWGSDIMGYQLT